MHSIKAEHRTTHELAYVRLTNHNQTAHLTKDCVRASHFRSPTTAALVRDRAREAYPAFTLSVTPCLCTTGTLYDTLLRDA